MRKECELAQLWIRPDSRQIPSHREYIGSNDYFDLLYGYLQSISIEDGDGSRFVFSRDVNQTRLGEYFGVTRQTMGTKIKGLQKLKLLSEKQGTKYRLTTLPTEYAALVPFDVLQAIVEQKVKYSISLYAYFLKRYAANEYQSFPWSLPNLKATIGLAQDQDNSNKVHAALQILQDLGLLHYWQGATNYEGLYKTTQFINWMRNTVRLE